MAVKLVEGRGRRRQRHGTRPTAQIRLRERRGPQRHSTQQSATTAACGRTRVAAAAAVAITAGTTAVDTEAPAAFAIAADAAAAAADDATATAGAIVTERATITTDEISGRRDTEQA